MTTGHAAVFIETGPAEGRVLNRKTLAAFKYAQDAFIGVKASLLGE